MTDIAKKVIATLNKENRNLRFYKYEERELLLFLISHKIEHRTNRSLYKSLLAKKRDPLEYNIDNSLSMSSDLDYFYFSNNTFSKEISFTTLKRIFREHSVTTIII